jgi:hypothetical protein
VALQAHAHRREKRIGTRCRSDRISPDNALIFQPMPSRSD